jgi:rubrerythrin
MPESVSMYSVQYWLESAPQGYLMGTEFGHAPLEQEPGLLLDDERLREQAIRTTVQIVIGERYALAASSGLINAAPDESSKSFLATQTVDEARHVEIFAQRLYDLGVAKKDLEDVIRSHANPNLTRFGEILLEKVDRRDFVAGIVAQNVILEGMAVHVFEMMQAANEVLNPKLAHTLAGAIADERRHVSFGETRIGSLIREHPEKKSEIERMQREMSHYMLAAFTDILRDAPRPEKLVQMRRQVTWEAGGVAQPAPTWQGAPIEALEPSKVGELLASAVLKEFKRLLERIGIEYQTPSVP